MERYDFTKFICPFGIAIIGTSTLPDNYLKYTANILSQLLDLDNDC